MSEDSKSATVGGAGEQDTFKEQMAARYRERISMGYIVPDASSGGPSSSLEDQNNTAGTQSSGILASGGCDSAHKDSELSPTPDTPSDTDMYRKRPVMKELITKFEARDTMHKENDTKVYTKPNLDQNALSSGSHSEDELNLLCNESGDVAPHATHYQAKISLTTAASCVKETTKLAAAITDPNQTVTQTNDPPQAHFRGFSKSKSKSPINSNPRATTKIPNQRISPLNAEVQRHEFHSPLNPNPPCPSLRYLTSSTDADAEVCNVFSKQKQEGIDATFASKYNSPRTYGSAQGGSAVTGHPPICPQLDSAQKEENTNPDTVEQEAPQRTNLRDIAMKSKQQSNGSKKDHVYVVHKKEWGKRFWDLRQHSSTSQISPRATSTPKPEEPNTVVPRVERGRLPAGCKTEHRRAQSALSISKGSSPQNNLNEASLETLKNSPKEPLTPDRSQLSSMSATPLNTQQRIIKRHITRLDAKKSNEKEEKRTTAMERYLEFLKTSTPPLHDNYNGAQGIPFLFQSYNGPSLTEFGKNKESALDLNTDTSSNKVLNVAQHEAQKQTGSPGGLTHDKISISPKLTLNPPKVIPSPFNFTGKEIDMVTKVTNPRRSSKERDKSPMTLRTVLGQWSYMSENSLPHCCALNNTSSPTKLKASQSGSLFISQRYETLPHQKENLLPKHKWKSQSRSPSVSPHRPTSQNSPNKGGYTRSRQNLYSPQSQTTEKENIMKHQNEVEQATNRHVSNKSPGNVDLKTKKKMSDDISPLRREISDLANRLLTKEELNNNDLMPKYLNDIKQVAATDGLSLYSSDDDSYPLSIDEKLKRIKTKRLLKMMHEAEMAKLEMGQCSEVEPRATLSPLYFQQLKRNSINTQDEPKQQTFSNQHRASLAQANQRPPSEPKTNPGRGRSRTPSPKTNCRQAKVPVPAPRNLKVATPYAAIVPSHSSHKDKSDYKLAVNGNNPNRDGRRRTDSYGQHGAQSFDPNADLSRYSPNNSITGVSISQSHGKELCIPRDTAASAQGDHPFQGQQADPNDEFAAVKGTRIFGEGQGEDAADFENHKEVAYHFGMTTKVDEPSKDDALTTVSDGGVKKKKKVKGDKTKKIKKKKKRPKEEDMASSIKSDSRNTSFTTGPRTPSADGTKKKKHPSSLNGPESTSKTKRQSDSRMSVRRPYCSEERRSDHQRQQDRLEGKAFHNPGHVRRRQSWSSDKTILAKDLTPPKSSKLSSPEKWSCYDTSGSVQWRSPQNRQRSLTRKSHVVHRVCSEPTERWPLYSNIPVLAVEVSPPRKQLEVLTCYRRWREDFMDCFRPCRLPLSEAFRKALDSAVMQEWSMHCWDSMSRYTSSDGSWIMRADDKEAYFSGSTSEDTTSHLGVGEKQRIQDVKLGPVKLTHLMYLLMGAVSLGMGHQAVTLYTCDGDDLDYYCSADDEESCLSQLAPALMGEVSHHIV